MASENKEPLILATNGPLLTKPCQELSVQASVEMSMHSRLCHSEGEDNRPYWHMVFSLHNLSCNKVMVLGLAVWPVLHEGSPTTMKWPEGEVVMKEGAFVCFSLNIPCNEDLDSPKYSFSWDYKVLPRKQVARRNLPFVESRGTKRERDEHDFKDGESLPTPLSVIQKETDEESNESTRDTWSKRISRFFRRKDNKRLKLNEE